LWWFFDCPRLGFHIFLGAGVRGGVAVSTTGLVIWVVEGVWHTLLFLELEERLTGSDSIYLRLVASSQEEERRFRSWILKHRLIEVEARYKRGIMSEIFIELVTVAMSISRTFSTKWLPTANCALDMTNRRNLVFVFNKHLLVFLDDRVLG
jgi:hypothetical protein